MASIHLVAEDEATGEVKEIFDEIKSTHGIDFVPNLYRAMAPNPKRCDAEAAAPVRSSFARTRQRGR